MSNKIYKLNNKVLLAIALFGNHLQKGLIALILILTFHGCESFVDIDPPKNLLVSKTVFKDVATVKSAMANIYFNMRDKSLLSGNTGLSIHLSTYSDELDYYLTNDNYLQFYQHTFISTNSISRSWWEKTYNLIYAANDIIEGLTNSTSLNSDVRDDYMAQALFVRAYLHSLLLNLFGPIPYINTTDYTINNTAHRNTESEVYEHIILDLKQAIQLFGGNKINDGRVLPNQVVAKALLSRIYLYDGQWEHAELMASEVIHTNNYRLESDISSVFLKESRETLWQFKPNGTSHKNAYEANEFIIERIPGQTFSLSNSLLESFEPGDLRKDYWVGSFTNDKGITLFFPFKYKETFKSTDESLEHSVVFRLAEQYLIRSEARAHLGAISDAQSDLNMVRNRAGLSNTTAVTESDLLTAIWQERKIEFFTEYGQRWFDLKRTNQAAEILSKVKVFWKETDYLFPVPASELELNPNLQPQNEGY